MGSSPIPALIAISAAQAGRSSKTSKKDDEHNKILLLERGVQPMKISENETLLVKTICFNETDGSYEIRGSFPKIVESSLETLLQNAIVKFFAKEFQLIPYAVHNGRVSRYYLLLKVNVQKELEE